MRHRGIGRETLGRLVSPCLLGRHDSGAMIIEYGKVCIKKIVTEPRAVQPQRRAVSRSLSRGPLAPLNEMLYCEFLTAMVFFPSIDLRSDLEAQ